MSFKSRKASMLWGADASLSLYEAPSQARARPAVPRMAIGTFVQ